MRISAISINGFRGITPKKKDPPAIEIDLLDKQNNPRNLLIFGPNAFGKSSIADAIEWFFKGESRGAKYFDEYSDEDNAHLNLGSPGYASKGFVELNLILNGDEYTLRRTFDTTGEIIEEDLAGLEDELANVQDEIIVLDHDQFRRFISEAHVDKWETFSGLIGYETLDCFRSGLSSLTGQALTYRLGTKQLEKQIEKRESQWRANVKSLQRLIGIDLDRSYEIEELVEQLRNKIQVIAISLDVTPSGEMDREFWDLLVQRSQPSETMQKMRRRAETLSEMSAALQPLPDTFFSYLEDLRSMITTLSGKKDRFDKELLATFYQQGLKAIKQQETEPNKCPFCKSAYQWEVLVTEVECYLTDLDFKRIQLDFEELQIIWGKVRDVTSQTVRRLEGLEIPDIMNFMSDMTSIAEISKKIRIKSFDERVVLDWVDDWLKLTEVINKYRKTVQQERTSLMQELSESGDKGSYQARVSTLREAWRELQNLFIERRKISGDKLKLDITQQTIDEIRKSARSFRDELKDFSGRVAERINDDIRRYYSELHPHDKIKPFLDVDVSGNIRRVFLKCDYEDFPGKDAASMLSESHRNSLGLAIMLAFRVYKQRLGSPLNFIVLDDVTQSLDTTHRTSLLDFLENSKYPEISSQQIFFLTHDRTIADLIKRFREQELRPNWVRYDIRNWWLHNIVLEPVKNPLQRAQHYIDQGDEIAAAIYARRALEQLYKSVLKRFHIKIGYKAKPWRYNLNDYRKAIEEEIENLHNAGEGLIDPEDSDFTRLFTSQRILNLTVHDSAFLDAPMTLQDVQIALEWIKDLRKMFSCQCGAWLKSLKLDRGGNMRICRSCDKPVRPD